MCATPHTLYPRPDGCIGALNLGRSTTRQAVRFRPTFWPHVSKSSERKTTHLSSRGSFPDLTGQDRTAVSETVSGPVKLIYASGNGISSEVPNELFRWAAWLGLETLLRVHTSNTDFSLGSVRRGCLGS